MVSAEGEQGLNCKGIVKEVEDELGDSVETRSIPVKVASEVIAGVLRQALSTYEFRDGEGHLRCGLVQKKIEQEMLRIADGRDSTMLWSSRLESDYQRKLRLIESRFRDWPEPARTEVSHILANGTLKK
jgi:hypothetical protein